MSAAQEDAASCAARAGQSLMPPRGDTRTPAVARSVRAASTSAGPSAGTAPPRVAHSWCTATLLASQAAQRVAAA
eukprot:4675280-Lingulodinium_polyedra.AAC.1